MTPDEQAVLCQRLGRAGDLMASLKNLDRQRLPVLSTAISMIDGPLQHLKKDEEPRASLAERLDKILTPLFDELKAEIQAKYDQL